MVSTDSVKGLQTVDFVGYDSGSSGIYRRGVEANFWSDLFEFGFRNLQKDVTKPECIGPASDWESGREISKRTPACRVSA